MTPVAYISHSDCGRHDTGWEHPEHVGRLRAIARAMRNDFVLYESLLQHEGRHATADELALAQHCAISLALVPEELNFVVTLYTSAALIDCKIVIRSLGVTPKAFKAFTKSPTTMSLP